MLAATAAAISLPIAEGIYRRHNIHRPCSRFAERQRLNVRAALLRGEPVYLGGISFGGFHNSGVALIEITRESGPRIICNNEDERFSGRKHSNQYPNAALAAMLEIMQNRRIAPQQVAVWLGTFDYPLFVASGIRTLLEEFPASINLIFHEPYAGFDAAAFRQGIWTPARLGKLFGMRGGVPIIGMPHHDNHATFSYLVSPFACDVEPTIVLVVDGAGDCASISAYVGTGGNLQQIYANDSLHDSIGTFYSVISSTQGGWTMLSSEGRYMGAAAYGDSNRATNPYYAKLRKIFKLEPDGTVKLNRSLANWQSNFFRNPYTSELVDVLGPPLSLKQMWNPDAVLRVEDIDHRPCTQGRVDKAAATQMVLEDALFHVIDGLIRMTGSNRLVLTGGVALNALANMHLLERFDREYYERTLRRPTRLHLWVPPVAGDAGTPLGAAYAFAASVGAGTGPPLEHPFYCGRAADSSAILAALGNAEDVAWKVLGDLSRLDCLEAIADLMAFITGNNGVIALFQGAAETGPRALGHRSILANACNPRTCELINERVKHREPIRPLAPMATLKAACDLFELSDGASDNDYSAYNYMVLTARAKPRARRLVPAVIHRDGTARIQIVRKSTDLLTYTYLKALGRRVGVEVAVNTSFNVAAPIAQTPVQALATLRRARALDGLFMISGDGPVFLIWPNAAIGACAQRTAKWVADWRCETGAMA